MKQTKKYKALISDMDGTLFPVGNDNPSHAVIEAIQKAQKYIHVGVATSRPYYAVRKTFEQLHLTGPSIVNGGSQIIDPRSKKILWEQRMEHQDAVAIFSIIKKLKKPLYVHENSPRVNNIAAYKPSKPLKYFIDRLTDEEADKLVDTLSPFSAISAIKLKSYFGDSKGVVIHHAAATKQHALFEVARILNISTSDIIGIGDDYNDFSLLMASGLKVAMGNAVEDLKAIADYVAPTVDEDGVADVINKFVL